MEAIRAIDQMEQAGDFWWTRRRRRWWCRRGARRAARSSCVEQMGESSRRQMVDERSAYAADAASQRNWQSLTGMEANAPPQERPPTRSPRGPQRATRRGGIPTHRAAQRPTERLRSNAELKTGGPAGGQSSGERDPGSSKVFQACSSARPARALRMVASK